jgi:flagellin
MASFSVVTNIGALNAHNQLVKTERTLQTTLNRMASGLRINGAKDDAAGLAIAENLRADVVGLNQAVRNANDGIAVINVADSALQEISNLLQRAMTLSEQAASDTSGADNAVSKTAINSEYSQILDEIQRIADTVEFNGSKLLAGSGTTLDIQVGLGSGTEDRVTILTTAINSTSLGLARDSLLTKSGARLELEAIQSAIDGVSANRGDLGAYFNRLDHTISVITTQAENLKAAESQIRDANMAQEVVDLTKGQVLNQTGLAALAQANATSQSILSLLR